MELAWTFGQNQIDGGFVTYREALRAPRDHQFFAAFLCNRVEILSISGTQLAWRVGWRERDWQFVTIDEALKEPDGHRLYAIVSGSRDDIAKFSPTPLFG